MYIQVRTVDTKTKVTIDISKITPVAQLKKMLESHFNIEPAKQRLFFRGKQLEDEYTLFDYNINLNDMVQIMEKVTLDVSQKKEAVKDKDKESSAGPSSCNSTEMSVENASEETVNPDKPEVVESSEYFKVGELVDILDSTFGAWFEARLVKIYKDQSKETSQEKGTDDLANDGYIYEAALVEEDEPVDNIKLTLGAIRPRAHEKVPVHKLIPGQKYLANYNIEVPGGRGYWYDCIITQTNVKKSGVTVHADVLVGSVPLSKCQLLFTDEIMKIEDRIPLRKRDPNTNGEQAPRSTEVAQNCDHCKNNVRRKCKECGCHICGLKTEENKQIMCDECDYAYHIWCLKPPLQQIPDVDEWYCHECKNDENEIVSAGNKLKESKKKAKMASKQNSSTRDWGKGMACVARTKVCSIVPFDHFGPIPGIEVGTLWKFRIQASEAGVHRPHVAGIHGRENIGAFSVVLSGGYEDDIDNGDEVYYTGSGGRDLSGNKRTNSQGFDQKLSRFNKALAMNCNTRLNEDGAEAKDWRGGKPVRVIRNYKLSKHSKFAPEEGNRYDGIYKVVKYFPKKGKSGLTVWRFMMRRDDPVPAPWTKEGKKRIESLGLEMQYPEGYLEAQQAGKKMDSDEESETPKAKGKGKKRVLEESPNPQPQASSTKKAKVVAYKLEDAVNMEITKDKDNAKVWNECQQELSSGKAKFLAKVEEAFTCICCTEVVFKPITTPCQHNFCTACLKRSFDADVLTCPTCRSPLDKALLKKKNDSLQESLNLLFPGYSAAR